MLIFQIICLCFTLFVLEKYVTIQVYSKTHRLMPLMLGLVGVYNFYQVVLCMTGQKALFSGLEDLLLIQVIYLVIHYIMDFYRVRLPELVEDILFTSWLLINVVVLVLFRRPQLYKIYYLIFCGICILVTLGLTIYAHVKNIYTKKEYFVHIMLFAAMFIAEISVLLRNNAFSMDGLVTSVALEFCCLIIYYLFCTDRMVDTESLIQENIYDAGYIPTFLFDADYYFLGANSAAKNLFPRLLAKARPGRNAGDYLEDVKKVIQNPNQELIVENQYYRFQVSPAYHRNQLKGYAIFILDITGQKKETREMELLKEQAEIQTILKGQFLARMSHDLRSPLHAIIGISDILADKWDISQKDRSLVRHIKDAGNTLLELVNSILEYSKLEAGKLELNLGHYNPENLLQELAHMCMINLRDKPVDFQMCIQTDYPAELVGDELRVREIIQNLLSNAVKFTQKGSVQCRISFAIQNAGKVRVTCCVEDTGPGMTQDQLQKIFQEYTSYTDERTLEGSGLGLCIVKQLAELMDGSAYAFSDGKTGSRVMVGFLQEIGSSEWKAPVTFNKKYLFHSLTAWKRSCTPNWVYPGARILLADDMKVNQEIFREQAALWEVQVDTVSNGREAVEAAEKKEYQLIFLDQMMPEMTGTEAAAEIRRRCNTPLIVLTAMLSDEIRTEFGKYGFTDFLAKPVDTSRLQTIIEKYIPEQYQKKPGFVVKAPARIEENNLIARRHILETFVEEIRPLMDALPDYAEQNLDLFRTKVHGIKGIGRQIGKMAVSEFAEILEMAAKTENISFIRLHLDDFLSRLEELLSDLEEELSYLPKPEQDITGEHPVKELFVQLKKGFDTYDLTRIEESLALLKAAKLSEDDRQLCMRLYQACREFEYEKGSRILDEVMGENKEAEL